MRAHICLVEDDSTIQELVKEKLQRKGFLVDAFDEAEALNRPFLPHDLYILDVMLQGDSSGLDLCDEIRKQHPEVPILILSALAEPQDRIEGLRLGADDYLGKPFEMEELILRVEGMLKRRQWYSLKPARGAVFRWDLCEIDFSNRFGKKAGEKFVLGQKECMIMKLLIENEGQTVSRDEILEKVWGYQVFPSNRTVDNFMVRLRKCFESDPAKPRYLHSVRGTGYRFISQSEGLDT